VSRPSKGFERGGDDSIQRSGSGDRVLIRLDSGATAPRAGTSSGSHQAIRPVDQAAEGSRGLQRRGVGGLVKSVDAQAGVIVLTSGRSRGEDGHRHTTKATILSATRRIRCASMRRSRADLCNSHRRSSCGREAQRTRTEPHCRRRGSLGQLPQHLRTIVSKL